MMMAIYSRDKMQTVLDVKKIIVRIKRYCKILAIDKSETLV